MAEDALVNCLPIRIRIKLNDGFSSTTNTTGGGVLQFPVLELFHPTMDTMDSNNAIPTRIGSAPTPDLFVSIQASITQKWIFALSWYYFPSYYTIITIISYTRRRLCNIIICSDPLLSSTTTLLSTEDTEGKLRLPWVAADWLRSNKICHNIPSARLLLNGRGIHSWLSFQVQLSTHLDSDSHTTRNSWNGRTWHLLWPFPVHVELRQFWMLN